MKNLFLFLFFIFLFSNTFSKGDLTRQKPIIKTVLMKSIEGSTHFYEPNFLEFETGILYKLILENKSNTKHYFTSFKFARSVFTRKIQVISNKEKVAEIKGNIEEVELFSGQSLEWWFVPVKTGLFDDLKCNVKDQKSGLKHSEMGMTGTIRIY